MPETPAAPRRARTLVLLAGALGLVLAGTGTWLLLQPVQPGWFAYAPLSEGVAAGGMRPSPVGIALLAVGATAFGGATGYLLGRRL